MTFDVKIKRNELDARLTKECNIRLSVLPSYSGKTFWEIFDIVIDNPCCLDSKQS